MALKSNALIIDAVSLHWTAQELMRSPSWLGAAAMPPGLSQPSQPDRAPARRTAQRRPARVRTPPWERLPDLSLSPSEKRISKGH